MWRVARSRDVRPAALAALLFCVACASAHPTAAAPSTPQTAVPSAPAAPVAEPSPQPDVCGYWTQTYQTLAARYGEIRDCLTTDGTRRLWLISTLGNARSRGVIAIFRCRSDACTDGRTDHPIGGWQIFPAPFAGGVTVLGQPSPSLLIIDNGGHEIEFDLHLLRFRT